MTKFYLGATLGALALTLASGSINAAPADFAAGQPRLPKALNVQHNGRQMKSDKNYFNASDKTLFAGRDMLSRLSVEGTQEPLLSFSNLPNYDYLEGPDGSTWFFTTYIDADYIEHNEYWTEEVIKGFTFTFYDQYFNEVGSVKDKIRIVGDETGCRAVAPDPTISARFFNNDDKIEVMVFFAMNTARYVNNYYYNVYSIGGEKDAEGNDVPVKVMKGRCVDAINIGGTGDAENFYFTFVDDPVYDASQIEKGKEVEYLNNMTFDLTTYKKAEGEDGPVKVMEKSIYMTRVPGDTTDGIYMITKKVGNDLYHIYSQYDNPYFIDPRGGAENEAMTPDNALLIECYKITGDEPVMTSTTLIPVEEYFMEDYLTYSFYSIGSVSWSNDVDMSVYGEPGKPAYIVSRSFVKAATLDDVLSSYDIFDNDGEIVKNLADDVENLSVLGSVNGDPLVLFIKVIDEQYYFQFGTLYGGDVLTTISQFNEGDPIISNCAVVNNADGSRNYVFEMATYDVDNDDNVYLRVAWFDEDGNLDHIDSVNLHKDIQYATVNLTPFVLDPYLYDDDPEMEYAVLVKRSHGSTARNEFVVVDHDGEDYALFSADEGKGDPYNFTVLPGEHKRLMMVYNNNYKYNVDIYDLPFTGKAGGAAGVDMIGASDVNNGETVIYNLQGVRVNSDSLQPGIYIVNGKKVAIR